MFRASVGRERGEREQREGDKPISEEDEENEGRGRSARRERKAKDGEMTYHSS